MEEYLICIRRIVRENGLAEMIHLLLFTGSQSAAKTLFSPQQQLTKLAALIKIILKKLQYVQQERNMWKRSMYYSTPLQCEFYRFCIRDVMINKLCLSTLCVYLHFWYSQFLVPKRIFCSFGLALWFWNLMIVWWMIRWENK